MSPYVSTQILSPSQFINFICQLLKELKRSYFCSSWPGGARCVVQWESSYSRFTSSLREATRNSIFPTSRCLTEVVADIIPSPALCDFSKWRLSSSWTEVNPREWLRWKLKGDSFRVRVTWKICSSRFLRCLHCLYDLLSALFNTEEALN